MRARKMIRRCGSELSNRRYGEREPWKGVAHLAQTPEDVIACAGSFYNQTLALGHLDLKKYDLPPKSMFTVEREDFNQKVTQY